MRQALFGAAFHQRPARSLSAAGSRLLFLLTLAGLLAACTTPTAAGLPTRNPAEQPGQLPPGFSLSTPTPEALLPGLSSTPDSSNIEALPTMPRPVSLTTSDGRSLAGRYYPPAAAGSPLLLLVLPANTDSMDWDDFALLAQVRGLGVLLLPVPDADAAQSGLDWLSQSDPAAPLHLAAAGEAALPALETASNDLAVRSLGLLAPSGYWNDYVLSLGAKYAGKPLWLCTDPTPAAQAMQDGLSGLANVTLMEKSVVGGCESDPHNGGLVAQVLFLWLLEK